MPRLTAHRSLVGYGNMSLPGGDSDADATPDDDEEEEEDDARR
jgi:hypothetical protein